MEDSLGQKWKNREFALVSVADLSSVSSSASPGIARFDSNGLQIHQQSQQIPFNVDLRTSQLFRLGSVQSVCMVEDSDADQKISYSKGVTIQFRNEEESAAFHSVVQQWKKEANVQGTYYAAVIENRADFNGRIVVDVGAGSGILSLFAAQAGAKHVYAVEASEMAEYARKLIAGNPTLAQRITVIKGKVEDVELPEKADILISEPMGTLLVNERMLESYVIARDRFLTPTGKMFPGVGRIHMAPFTDEYLFIEIANKALFWQQQNYYGVDLTPLHGTAFQGYFSQVSYQLVFQNIGVDIEMHCRGSNWQTEFGRDINNFIHYCLQPLGIYLLSVPVVDAFDPRLLIAPPMFHVIDFTKIKEEELYEIDIPLRFIASVGARVHGLACWFDVLFNGSTVQRWLTTAPGSPTTHWYQLRCVLSQPIYVMAGQEITGRLHLIAHNAQSYTIYLTLSAKMWGPGAEQGGILQTSSCKLDLKEPYYRMSQPQAYALAQDQQPQPLIQTQDIHIQSQELDEPDIMQQPSPNRCAQIDSLMQNV
ncbi:S-adenosyl-L-methionine-dependent methyltransferase [Sesbania bispinosa]|nr:S-adenosyl-L-methionine-dependent methyltransferase [Sesbania bispinosa]